MVVPLDFISLAPRIVGASEGVKARRLTGTLPQDYKTASCSVSVSGNADTPTRRYADTFPLPYVP